MATFSKRGDLQWQVKIRRSEYPFQSKTFNTKAEAEAWARQIETEMDRGVFVSRTEAENTTLSEALDRYQQEVSSLKKGGSIESVRIRQWKNHPLASHVMATIRGSDIAAYRDVRLKEGKSPSSIRLELAIISHLFTIAKKEWGMESLSNPVLAVRLPSPSPARERRLEPGELEAIIANTDSPLLEPIVRFALETGMRRGEIVVMKWEDVDLKKKVLRIPVTKNGKSRTIPLLFEAMRILGSLPRRIDGSVWGLKDPHSITQAFKKACKRAKVKDLRFHDLRHEATSRFFEKGLNVMEVAAITGHETLQMLKRYTHLKAEDLGRKLEG